MADSKFFTNSGPFSLKELSNISGASLNDEGFASLEVTDVAPLNKATKNQISFLDNVKYIANFRQSKSGACVIREKYAKDAPIGMALLISENPYHAYALISSHFYSANKATQAQISSQAVISSSAIIGNNCHIESGVVIGDNVRIGDGCRILANSTISASVEIGNNCTISSSVNISYAKIGNRVLIHSGVCIGQDGFGFAFGGTSFIKVPQLGRVIIEDDVEIGANSCIDRGSSPDTIIGEGTKIDNLVQIAHNVKIGKHCVIAGASGIAGSSELGDYVIIGGHVAISGHLKIGSGAKIGGKSGVTRNINAGAEVVGMPAVPIKQHLREVLTLQKLSRK